MNPLSLLPKGAGTYAVAGVTILYAVSAALLGHIDANHAVELILGALGLSYVRRALP